MIVNRRTYASRMTKRLLKNGHVPPFIGIVYDVLDEFEVLDYITRYTTNCIIVQNDDSLSVDIGDIKLFDYEKARKNNISPSELLNSFDGIGFFSNAISNKRIICFNIQIDEFKFLRNNYYSMFVRSYLFTLLNKKITNSFSYDDLILHNSVVIPIYRKRYRENNISILNDNSYIFELMGGIGDYFMNYSLILEAIENKEISRIYIAQIDKNSKSSNLNELFYPHTHKITINNQRMNEVLLTETIKSNCTSLFKEVIKYCDTAMNYSGMHVTEIVRIILGLDAKLDLHKYNSEVKQHLIGLLSEKEKDLIDNKIHGKRAIGFQYFTGSFDSENNYCITDSHRNWSRDNVEEFFRLSKIHNLEIIDLNQNCFGLDHKSMYFEKLSLFGYVYLISKLSLVVGIDSSAGHIASFYNIPTITIWGKQTPTDYYGRKISFRVLRNNTSLVSKEKNADCITPQSVIDSVLRQFNSKNGCSSNISFEMSASGYQIITL